MNGNSSITSTSIRVPTSYANRPGPFNQLYPPGSNVRSLSSGNYFSNIQNYGTANLGSISRPLNPGQGRFAPTGLAKVQKAGPNSLNLNRSSDFFLRNAAYSPKNPNNVSAFSSASTNSSILRPGGTLSTGANVAKGASKAASSAAGPIGLAAQVSQALGEAVGSQLNVRDQGISQQDYQHNIQQYSVANSQNAKAIAGAQANAIANRSSAASIGSLFGPIGALAGYYGAKLTESGERGKVEVNSFAGGVDPTDSGIARSSSTANPSGKSDFKDSINDGIPLPAGAS